MSHSGVCCAVLDCNTAEFLPFECDQCNGVFCRAHRSYAAHGCIAQAKIPCPLCGVRFGIETDGDRNAAFERHTLGGKCLAVCGSVAPARANPRRPRPRRCGAPGCHAALKPSDEVTCAACGLTTCLKCRFPDDHDCPARISPAQPRLQAKRSCISVARGQGQGQGQGLGWTRQGGRDRGRAMAGGAGVAGEEQCPHCALTFRSVTALIAHVEAFHAAEVDVGVLLDTEVTGSGAERLEVCPICAARFVTVEELVQHSTTMHPTVGMADSPTDTLEAAALETRTQAGTETSDNGGDGGGRCVMQ